MYPSRELNDLDLRKEALVQRIAVRRQICVVSGRRAAHPLLWIDQAREKFQQWAPWLKIAAAPAALVFGRFMRHRLGWVGSLLRVAPGVIGLFKAFSK